MLQWDTQWSPSSSSYRDCDSQNYARKAPPYLTGAFHLTRKTAAYNLRDSNFNLALEIQHRIPEKELFVQRCKAMEFSPNYDYSRTVFLGFKKSLCSLGLQCTNYVILVVYLPTLIPVCPSIKLSVRPSVPPSVRPYVNTRIPPSFLSVRPPIHLSISISVWLSVCMSASLSIQVPLPEINKSLI